MTPPTSTITRSIQTLLFFSNTFTHCILRTYGTFPHTLFSPFLPFCYQLFTDIHDYIINYHPTSVTTKTITTTTKCSTYWPVSVSLPSALPPHSTQAPRHAWLENNTHTINWLFSMKQAISRGDGRPANKHKLGS